MSKLDIIKKKSVYFIVAFSIILSGLTSLITPYTFADSNNSTSVIIDGKKIDVYGAETINQFRQEYQENLKELQKNGYKTTNDKFTTKTKVFDSNSTSDQGNTQGTYLLPNDTWTIKSLKYDSGEGVESHSIYTALFSAENNFTKEFVDAYCIDLYTDTNVGRKYNSEYIELLKYNSDTFKAKADKLRTIVANSFPSVSIQELRHATGVKDLTEADAVRATQFLLWSKVHNYSFRSDIYYGNILRGYGFANIPSPHRGEGGLKTNLAMATMKPTSRERKAESDKLFKVVSYLDSLEVVDQKALTAEADIDIRRFEFERDSNDLSNVRVNFEYKIDGKNSDNTDLTKELKYYIGERELESSEINILSDKKLQDGYNKLEFNLSSAKFSNNEDLKIAVRVNQKINIINALLSSTNDYKSAQTLITTKKTENIRTFVKEAVISSQGKNQKYSLKFKTVEKDEIDNAGQNDVINSVIKGSALQLEDYQNNIIDSFTTNENGLIEFSNLNPGVYTLKEVKTPQDYEKISEAIKLIIRENGEVLLEVHGKVYSSKTGLILPIPSRKSLGELDFIKVDENQKPLANASLEIYRKGENSPILTAITNPEGKLSIVGAKGEVDRITSTGNVKLGQGSYYFKEIKAPQGYLLNEEIQNFEIRRNEITKAVLQNKKIEAAQPQPPAQNEETVDFTVRKVWLDPLGKPMSSEGLTINVELYRDGHRLYIRPTGEDGTVVFEKMPKYNPETKQPYKYTFTERNTQTYDITQLISEVTQGNTTTFTNKFRGGCFDFIKEDASGEPVEGAVIGVYDAKTNELLFEGTTTKEGRLDNLTNGYQDRLKKNHRIVMVIGDYYLKEKSAPAGYILNEDKVNFTVTEYQCTDLLKIVNKKENQEEKMTLIAEKIWQDAIGNPIKDNDYTVVVELYQNGKKIDEKTIRGNDSKEFTDLPKKDPKTNTPYEYEFREKDQSVDSIFVSKDTVDNKTIFVSKLTSGELDFTKVEFSTSNAVPGATITIYREGNNETVVQGITDEQGKINNPTIGAQRVKNGKVILEAGRYYFVETEAPSGYVLNDARQAFEIKKDTVEKATFENKKATGFVTIINKDGSTQEFLPDGVFDIYKNVNGQPSGSAIRIGLVIPQTGTTIELMQGDYIAVLITPPSGGYELPNIIHDRHFKFTIDKSHTADNPREVIVYHSKKADPIVPTTSPILYVTTLDQGRNALGGATVEIYKKGEMTPIIFGQTNSNGKLDRDTANGIQKDNIQPDGRIELEFGDYEIKETKAPTGYIGPSDTKYVSLTTENLIAIVDLINTKEVPAPEMISIIINEKWINIPSGKTADDYKAVVKLMRNGEEISSATITGDNSYKFDNLPKQDSNGQDYVYDVIEELESETRQVSKTKQGDYIFDFVNEPIQQIVKGEVTVKYIVVNKEGVPTGKVLSEERLTGDVGTPYQTQEKTFNGYTFVRIDDTKAPKNGEFKLTAQEVIYEYKESSSTGGGTNPPVKGRITVSYIVVDENNNPTNEVLETPTIMTGDVGTAYNTIEKSFKGYVFVRVNPTKAQANGQFTATEQEVVYEYRKLPLGQTKVTVKYIVVDENGYPTGKVLETQELMGIEGESYTTTQKDFEGYTFVRVDNTKASVAGNFKNIDQEVVYEYKAKGKVTVRYIEVDENDKATGKVLEEPTVMTGEIGKSYTTSQKSFSGYTFVRVNPKHSAPSGNFTTTEQEVVYEYRQTTSGGNSSGGGNSSSGGSSSGGDNSSSGGSSSAGGNSSTNPSRDNDSTQTKPSERARIIAEIIGSGKGDKTVKISEEETPKSKPEEKSDAKSNTKPKITIEIKDQQTPKSTPTMIASKQNHLRLPKTGETNTMEIGFALLGLGLIALIKRRNLNK